MTTSMNRAPLRMIRAILGLCGPARADRLETARVGRPTQFGACNAKLRQAPSRERSISEGILANCSLVNPPTNASSWRNDADIAMLLPGACMLRRDIGAGWPCKHFGRMVSHLCRLPVCNLAQCHKALPGGRPSKAIQRSIARRVPG